MQSACPGLARNEAFLSGVLNYVDCQAQAVGQGGYLALAAPGSSASLLLTAVLTVFIALVGYRMLFGEMPTAREGVISIVKIGMVLVLATSWPAFRTLAYDVVMHGPATLASRIGGPAGLPGAGGGLVAHLQLIDDELIDLAYVGVLGRFDASEITVPPEDTETVASRQQQIRKQSVDPARTWKLLNSARTIYLTATIAAFASVRLVAGLLLALGPLFALFLLFDATRGLFEGWIRVLAGAALGGLSTAVVLGVEIALLEPWMGEILSDRYAGFGRPEVAVELFVVMLVFAAALLACLFAVTRVAIGFRLPGPWQAEGVIRSRRFESAADHTNTVRNAPAADAGVRSRAMSVADAVRASEQREHRLAGRSTVTPAVQTSAGSGGQVQVTAASGLGQGQRRVRRRTSTTARRRDAVS